MGFLAYFECLFGTFFVYKLAWLSSEFTNIEFELRAYGDYQHLFVNFGFDRGFCRS